MGFGDEIMVTGEARRLQRHDPRPVAVLDRAGRVRRHPLWAGNPRIATPEAVAAGLSVQTLRNHPGARPYIDYTRSTAARWAYTNWRATPGELYLERRAPAGFVVVEPNLKPGASPNKDWGRARWQALVELLPLDWVQLGPPGTRRLAGVRRIETGDFRAACRVLSAARAAVLPEGGLHHAAAALGVPAVVLFGGMTDPVNTGYQAHVNLTAGGSQSPCGRRRACAHCAAAMAAITPEQVAAELERLRARGAAAARSGEI